MSRTVIHNEANLRKLMAWGIFLGTEDYSFESESSLNGGRNKFC